MMDEKNNVTTAPEKVKEIRKAAPQVRLATAIGALVIAIVIIFELFLKALPTNILEFDISQNKLYEVSDTTVEFLADLKNDIEIIVINDETTLDQRLVKFLDRYQLLSDRLTVTYIDPVEHPSVLDTYDTNEETVVVRCEDTGRQNIININGFDTYEECIFGFDYMYYYYQDTYSLNSFDADGQLTSAINSVVNEKTKMIYYTEGHGESEMNPTVEASIYKAGYKTGTVNLLRDGGIPEDCDLLIMNVPTNDLADDEYEMIIRYMDNGGKSMLLIDDNKLENFKTLMADYGLKINEGYLGDKSNYYSAYVADYGYYCIAPMLSTESDITKDLKQAALILYGRGMTRITANHPNVAVENFMTTSSSGICYYDENNSIEGSFIIGAVSTQTLADGGTARMTTISSQYIINKDLIGTTTNMSNTDIVLNAITANFGDVESALNIPAKNTQLSYNNSINTPLWNALFIAIIPIAFLAIGFATWNSRRKH